MQEVEVVAVYRRCIAQWYYWLPFRGWSDPIKSEDVRTDSPPFKERAGC